MSKVSGACSCIVAVIRSELQSNYKHKFLTNYFRSDCSTDFRPFHYTRRRRTLCIFFLIRLGRNVRRLCRMILSLPRHIWFFFIAQMFRNGPNKLYEYNLYAFHTSCRQGRRCLCLILATRVIPRR